MIKNNKIKLYPLLGGDLLSGVPIQTCFPLLGGDLLGGGAPYE